MITLTSTDIAAGSLKEIAPELYELSTVYEINPWHNHQSVFDHTVAVVAAIEQVFTFDFLYEGSRKGIKKYVEDVRDGYAKKDVSFLAGLFHDMGKGATIEKNEYTGMTQCPEHEKLGAKLVAVPLRKLKVTGQALKDVKEIIKRHGEIHEVVNRVIRNNEPEKEFIQFKATTGELYLQCIIQGYADTMGSDLKTLSPKEFKKREIIFREALNRFATSL